MYLFVCPVEADDGSDLRPTMTLALNALKSLRTSLLTCSSQVGEVINKNGALQEENAKLKYQIKHLKRSMDGDNS